MLGPQRCVAKVKISERKFNRYQRGFPERYYAEKTALNQVCETGQIMFPNSSAIIHYVLTKIKLTLCLSSGAKKKARHSPEPSVRQAVRQQRGLLVQRGHGGDRACQPVRRGHRVTGAVWVEGGEVHTLCVTSKYFCLAIKSTFAHIFRLS